MYNNTPKIIKNKIGTSTDGLPVIDGTLIVFPFIPNSSSTFVRASGVAKTTNDQFSLCKPLYILFRTGSDPEDVDPDGCDCDVSFDPRLPPTEEILPPTVALAPENF